MPTKSKARLATGVLDALRRANRARHVPAGDGMTDVLMSVILARGASMTAARKSLAAIRESVVNWNELRVTQPWEIAGFLGDIRDAETKACAIHDVLTNIFEGSHDLELSFLEGASAQEARDFLAGLGGLTEEMVNEVILAGRGHFQVTADTDVVRVAQRLGVVGRRVSSAKCQMEIEELLGPEKSYQMCYLLKDLGETTCTARGYRCQECSLGAMCTFGRKGRVKSQ